MCVFHEYRDCIYTVTSHLLTLKAHITKKTLLSSSAVICLTNSVDPDQTAPVGIV